MNWQREIQLTDLDEDQKLEVTCKKCGYSRYEAPHELVEKYGLHFAYIDEVEKFLTCHKHGCRGRVRVSLSAETETEGFVGGLA